MAWFRHLCGWWQLFDFPQEVPSVERYDVLRRKINTLIVTVTLTPLFLMAGINYHLYKSALEKEVVTPLRAMVNKTKHSFELFLHERQSAVSFIASAYTYDQLADPKTLNRIFHVARKEFDGLVDLGLINGDGVQVNYVGPYALKGKDYSEQQWFHEVRIRGAFISEVFMGFRNFPHIIIAVEGRTDSGQSWTLRATIDTDKFKELIASMGLAADSDAFLINRNGVLQTRSAQFGDVLERIPLAVPPVDYQPRVSEITDAKGRRMLMAASYLVHPNLALVVVTPTFGVMRAWYTLKGELLIVFVTGLLAILIVVFRLTHTLVDRIQHADQRREAAYREMEHTHKLSSIGRLAAGVAHEINNPLAIVNEKAGLMMDILAHSGDFHNRDRFLSMTDKILQSVKRCRTITHRLLGFARRMDVHIENLDINEVIREVLGFLEKEAHLRNLDLRMQLAESMPRIDSDQGQLQQVFLNILNNAFAAVENGGIITITTWQPDPDTVAASIKDNGCGISEKVQSQIFEPFFTTKQGKGTGLGLAITYGIVKKLGGRIEVQSAEGKGATFTITLPLQAPDASGGMS
ncbi:MAG: ATP-binding protein [Desulfovibrionaceae bacterium]